MYILALAVYTRSPAAYEALRNLQILQLPSVTSLKQFTSANIHDAGPTEEILAKAHEDYVLLQKKKRKNKKVPFTNMAGGFNI